MQFIYFFSSPDILASNFSVFSLSTILTIVVEEDLGIFFSKLKGKHKSCSSSLFLSFLPTIEFSFFMVKQKCNVVKNLPQCEKDYKHHLKLTQF